MQDYTRYDPYGQETATSTKLQGVQVGSEIGGTFGPAGAIIGGAVGLVGGAALGTHLGKKEGELLEKRTNAIVEDNTSEAASIKAGVKSTTRVYGLGGVIKSKRDVTGMRIGKTLKGPSHEQGGIDIGNGKAEGNEFIRHTEQGTEIYSKDLKGLDFASSAQTLADKKTKLEGKLETADKYSKNDIMRELDFIEKQYQKLMTMQGTLNGGNTGKQSFALGGINPDEDPRKIGNRTYTKLPNGDIEIVGQTGSTIASPTDDDYAYHMAKYTGTSYTPNTKPAEVIPAEVIPVEGGNPQVYTPTSATAKERNEYSDAELADDSWGQSLGQSSFDAKPDNKPADTSSTRRTGTSKTGMSKGAITNAITTGVTTGVNIISTINAANKALPKRQTITPIDPESYKKLNYDASLQAVANKERNATDYVNEHINNSNVAAGYIGKSMASGAQQRSEIHQKLGNNQAEIYNSTIDKNKNIEVKNSENKFQDDSDEYNKWIDTNVTKFSAIAADTADKVQANRKYEDDYNYQQEQLGLQRQMYSEYGVSNDTAYARKDFTSLTKDNYSDELSRVKASGNIVAYNNMLEYGTSKGW